MDKPLDLASRIIDYETGGLSDSETLSLFSGLVKTELAWTLQGHYGRTAAALIERGYLDRQGTILKEVG